MNKKQQQAYENTMRNSYYSLPNAGRLMDYPTYRRIYIQERKSEKRVGFGKYDLTGGINSISNDGIKNAGIEVSKWRISEYNNRLPLSRQVKNYVPYVEFSMGALTSGIHIATAEDPIRQGVIETGSILGSQIPGAVAALKGAEAGVVLGPLGIIGGATLGYLGGEAFGAIYDYIKNPPSPEEVRRAHKVQMKQTAPTRFDNVTEEMLKDRKKYIKRTRRYPQVFNDYLSSYTKQKKWKKPMRVNNQKLCPNYKFHNTATVPKSSRNHLSKSAQSLDKMIAKKTKNLWKSWSRWFRKIKRNANGNFVNGPTLSWVGEAGPEVIIPLSGNKKDRGIHLWQQAGQALGVPGYANGGFVGGIPENQRSTGNKQQQGINVSVGNINISLLTGKGEKNSGTLLSALKEQREEVADELCNILADALESAYQNIPAAQ